MSTVVERFLRYIKINTGSAEEQEEVPSTKVQWELADLLVKEMKEIGISNVRLAENCYVYGTIPGNTSKELPALGFIAHMDTSNAVTGEGVKPRIIKNYDGKDILLHETPDITMAVKEFPELINHIGSDLIVTDGTTLLGADDKAGVAEIMAMAEYLLAHPEIEHGVICIGFTPDEEVGRGVDFFDVNGFGAEYAYTIDGGELGEIEYENFNAASAKLIIQGTSVHPGTAKNKMKNALLIGMEFQSMLPAAEDPSYTEKYEGFYHLCRMEGGVEHAVLNYIIRDHDLKKLEAKKSFVETAAAFINKKYGFGTCKAEITDTYYNMAEKIAPHMHLIANAKAVMERNGIVPRIIPIRGGTDGARLSYMGLPCPNLCTGGANFHGKYEYISIQSMEKIVEMLVDLACNYDVKLTMAQDKMK